MDEFHKSFVLFVYFIFAQDFSKSLIVSFVISPSFLCTFVFRFYSFLDKDKLYFFPALGIGKQIISLIRSCGHCRAATTILEKFAEPAFLI